ncbi:Hexokinase-7, putative [Perkinsus marinus ATCC 50983]|uniref:Phosphotransferase n=1 Tax=Perkinsus marinus (strain ATCC 50983 / TXsc) TaxID=423536 RepID=C5LF91_PERM5|nr:Hexokinase-7, putative [Perkinsus marinus ATCC 50983]EER04606.1 Hexokinase-7, putative [Perkinsus marinus ATCC 50983]|eukprot:XP_002772790.1 Hexokinase-7, putative [Perkinsus marinus ATCC 50983]
MVSTTLPSDISDRLTEAVAKFETPKEVMIKVKDDFLEEMKLGWEAGQGAGAPSEASSVKMLTSHINVLPRGHEAGIYYALDLGGTNLRVLRVVLSTEKQPEIAENRKPIPHDVMGGTAEDLFGFIAATAKELTDKFHDDDLMPAGFTFSFPMSQSAINHGKLIEWTKGFSATGVVGEDPATLLNKAFEEQGVPIYVAALCNDTVGTLMTCSYEFEGCGTCRVGMIIGTGTNAAYSDPTLGNLVVNTEWGGYNFKEVPSVLNCYDEAVDKASPNMGKQYFEKTISGMYLGELTRLATRDVLKGYSAHLPDFLNESGLDTKYVCAALEGENLGCDDEVIMTVFRGIGEAVLERSARLCASALSAVAQKCDIMDNEKRHMREVCIVHGMPRSLTIGVDGSLYQKGYRYPQRLDDAFAMIIGKSAASLVHTVHSSDGSGVGAALVAAAVSR